MKNLVKGVLVLAVSASSLASCKSADTNSSNSELDSARRSRSVEEVCGKIIEMRRPVSSDTSVPLALHSASKGTLLLAGPQEVLDFHRGSIGQTKCLRGDLRSKILILSSGDYSSGQLPPQQDPDPINEVVMYCGVVSVSDIQYGSNFAKQYHLSTRGTFFSLTTANRDMSQFRRIHDGQNICVDAIKESEYVLQVTRLIIGQ